MRELVTSVLASCRAAVSKELAGGRSSGNDEPQDEPPLGSLPAGSKARAAGAPGCGGEYSAAEGQRERRLLLSELRNLVPPQHAALLVPVLLDSDLAGHGGSGVGGGSAAASDAAGGERRQGARAKEATAARCAVLRQYPSLAPALLLGAAARLVLPQPAAMAPWLATQSGHGTAGPNPVGGSGAAQTAASVHKAAAWLDVLLAPAVAAARAGAQPGAARPGKQAQRQEGGKTQASAAAEVAEWQPGAEHACWLLALLAATPSEQQQVALARAQELTAPRLRPVRQLSAMLSGGSCGRGGGACGVPAAPAAALAPGGLAAQLERLHGLAALSVPAVPPPATKGAACAAPSSSMAPSQLTDFEAACALQRQLLGKRRRRSGENSNGISTSRALGLPADVLDPAGPVFGCWRHVSAWVPCAIGCMPNPLLPGGAALALDAPQQPPAPQRGQQQHARQRQSAAARTKHRRQEVAALARAPARPQLEAPPAGSGGGAPGRRLAPGLTQKLTNSAVKPLW